MRACHFPVVHRAAAQMAIARTADLWWDSQRCIRNLRDFLDASGWNPICGLNMGTGTAENAANEAAFVMDVAGPKLIAFQMCNEPDSTATEFAKQIKTSRNLRANGGAFTRAYGRASRMRHSRDRIRRTITNGSRLSQSNSRMTWRSSRTITKRNVRRQILPRRSNACSDRVRSFRRNSRRCSRRRRSPACPSGSRRRTPAIRAANRGWAIRSLRRRGVLT